MPVFGEFEASEEIARSARVAVWKAKKRSIGIDEALAVKVCQAADWEEDSEDAEAAMEDFAEAAQEMRRLYAVEGHWIPVLGTGSGEKEAWYATRFYPRSLERVIEGRIPVDSPTLHWIATSIVAGLTELDRQLHRAHGNLKPSNVFIDGAGQLMGAPVFLSDLRARREIMPADMAGDFQGLGRILLQLVRRRPLESRSAVGWPLGPGPEWNRLGRRGDAWRDICNGLLKPAPSPADLDWEAFSLKLRPLEQRQSNPWVRVLAAAVPFIVLAGGACYLRFTPYEDLPVSFQGLAGRLGNAPPVRQTVPPEWALLCNAYYDWLGDFAETVQNPVRSARWERDPYLQGKILNVLQGALSRNESFDPRKFDSRIRGDLPDLASRPPPAAMDGLIAAKVIDDMKAVQQTQAALAAWPEIVRLRGLAERFDGIGWKQPAQELRGAADKAAGPALRTEAIDGVLDLSAEAARIETLWQTVDGQKGVLAGSGDPVLAGLFDFYCSNARDVRTVQELDGRLAEMSQDMGRKAAIVRNDLNTRYSGSRFLNESFVKAFRGPVTAQVVARWEAELQDYAVVPPDSDPRKSFDWAGKLTGTRARLAGMLAEDAGGEAAPVVARLRGRADGLKERLDALQKPATLLRKDLAAISPAVDALKSDLLQLDIDIGDAAAQTAPNPAAWVAKARATEIGAPASALAEAWAKKRDSILAHASPEAFASSSALYRRIRGEEAWFEAVFTGLAGRSGVAAPASFDPAGIDPALADYLRRSAEARAIDEILASMPADGAASQTPEAFLGSARVRAIIARQAEALEQSREVGLDCTRAAVVLSQAAGLDDSLVTAVERWRGLPPVSEEPDDSPIRKIADEVAAIAGVNRETSSTALAEKLKDSRFAVSLAAWRRLCGLGSWPEPEDLAGASSVAAGFEKGLEAAVPDAGRRSALKAELSDELKLCWRGALRRAGAVGPKVEAVMAAVGSFSIDETSLAPRERFNLMLYRMRQRDWQKMSQNQANFLLNSVWIVQFQILSMGVSDPDIDHWIRRLREIRSTADEGTAVQWRLQDQPYLDTSPNTKSQS